MRGRRNEGDTERNLISSWLRATKCLISWINFWEVTETPEAVGEGKMGEMDNNLSSQFLSSATLQSSHSAHHSHEFADCTRLSSPWHQWAGSKGTQSNTIWVRLLGRLCQHKVCKSPSTQNGDGSSGWNKRGVRPRESDFARSVFLKGELKKMEGFWTQISPRVSLSSGLL